MIYNVKLLEALKNPKGMDGKYIPVVIQDKEGIEYMRKEMIKLTKKVF